MPTRQVAVTGYFLAAAFPPLLPAFFFWALVPPCELFPLPEWLFLPPFFDAPGEFAILAARSLDMPLSLRASYWSSFFTFADFEGIADSSRRTLLFSPWVPVRQPLNQARALTIAPLLSLSIDRPITMRWIWLVPSKICMTFASRM